MGRRLREHAEVVRRAHQPLAEMPLPDAVDDHPRGERVRARRDPAGQLAPAAPLADRRLGVAGEESRQPPRHDRAEPGVTAADVDRARPGSRETGRPECRLPAPPSPAAARGEGRSAAGRARRRARPVPFSIAADRRLLVERGQLRLGSPRSRRSCFSLASTRALGTSGTRFSDVLAALGAQVLEDVRAVEDAGQGVVVLLRDRVELVVVAAGTAERQARGTPCRRCRSGRRPCR